MLVGHFWELLHLVYECDDNLVIFSLSSPVVQFEAKINK